ncbi:hypothetical protein CC78DRAFT_543563 [Lojkania enalia]|uniref:Tafazzin n=1 Tax=Lojkania enalia TaxID=147567 RepID=A0A9P4KAE0_9PLEO|nr:hypothetical protein CC78DRAFT_543563 [Didymosphaeria enalia]
MPKKHTPAYSRTKPSYIHPSLQTFKSSSSSAQAAPQTVNERIQQLRREQAPRTTSERRDEVIEVVTRRTVPPELRRILQMAEVDAPPPKPGSRTRPRAGTRPPPGPAAPTSWLRSIRNAPDYIRGLNRKWMGEEGRVGSFGPLARVHDDEFKRLPQIPSLVHSCLKTLTLHWEELVEYEQYYLPTLPIPLKEALLSYLSLYAPRDCVDFKSFKILFSNDKEIENSTGSEEIRLLDLTNLLNPHLTLTDLQKSLSRSFPSAPLIKTLKTLSLDTSPVTQHPSVPIAESWDDEPEPEPGLPQPSPAPSVPFFPSLTRLSLAHPGAIASWTTLLSLSANLRTLTHLSLAYWPTPSITPNAATTSMISKHSTVALGGSHFYSRLDDDWAEAANILRRLSLNMYSLRWLDLEGCTWVRALVWGHSEELGAGPGAGAGDNTRFDAAEREGEEGWIYAQAPPGPDWNGAWCQIEYVNLFQGWIPVDQRAIMRMPAGVIPVQLLGWLRRMERARERIEEEGVGDGLKSNSVSQRVKNTRFGRTAGSLRNNAIAARFPHDESIFNEAGATVNTWVEREKTARAVASTLLALRAKGKGKWICVDYGWEPGSGDAGLRSGGA